MSREGSAFDKKSLKVLDGGNKQFQELAKDCVAFANAAGGHLFIGIEDNSSLPPADQRVEEWMIEKLNKRISQLTLNVWLAPQKIIAKNGGEYIELQITRNTQNIASTSDGRYYIRISDDSRPLLPDELGRLMNDKTAYVWETQTSQKVPRHQVDDKKRQQFLDLIRGSERVTQFVKLMIFTSH